jgi:hypothetical protein
MRIALVVTAFSLFFTCAPVHAQELATGTVIGCVTDASGVRLPGVEVTVGPSGTTRSAVTDSSGCYRVLVRPSSNVVVEAKLAAFMTAKRDSVVVIAGAEVRVDLSMYVSGVSDPPSVVAGTMVIGCVTDLDGGSLPGIEVTVSGEFGFKERIITGVSGCYSVPNVPIGAGVVEAKLVGFRTERREVAVGRGTTRADFALCVGELAEVDYVLPPSYEEVLRGASLVLHVRVTGRVSALEDCYAGWDQVATILHVVKAPEGFQRDRPITFRQTRSGLEREPYAVGAELVVALSESRGRVSRVAGPFAVFIVDNNRVRQAFHGPYGSYDGRQLDDFLKEIGRLVR